MKYRTADIGIIKKLFILTLIIFPCLIVTAQGKTRFATHVQGKIKRSTGVYKFIQGFRALPDIKASSLAETVNKIEDAVCSMPQLNPPMGFNAENGVATYATKLKDKEPSLQVYCYLRYLEKDAHSGVIKTSMDGADIYFDVNGFDLFQQIGNYWQDCDRIRFPVFFEALPITDSTADYMETTIKGRTVRIITTNKTLFVPLTRKEFLQFLVARDRYRIMENKKLINEENRQISDTKKNISDPAYQSIKSTLEQTIPTMEGQIKKLNNEIQSLQQKITHFQELMNAMSLKEANAPVRMDYSKKSDEIFGLEQLLPAGSRAGVLITRVNPAYYNYAAHAPAAQLIVAYYSWPTAGFEKDPDYVQQTALDIFRQLDYHALKMSLQ